MVTRHHQHRRRLGQVPERAQAPGKVARRRPPGIKQVTGVDDEVRPYVTGDAGDLSEHRVEVAVAGPLRGPLPHGPPEVPVRRMQQAHQQASLLQEAEPPAASAGFPETIHQKTLVLSGKLWKLW